jgi:hypothetical protein
MKSIIVEGVVMPAARNWRLSGTREPSPSHGTQATISSGIRSFR